MRSIKALVDTPQAMGAVFRIEGDKVSVGGTLPLPEELLAQLRENKGELISYLSGLPSPISSESKLSLLAWASELAEQNIVLHQPVVFQETPLRTITTDRVSRQASIYLRVISMSRTNKQTGGWHPFTADWWREQEREALYSLVALKLAIEQSQQKGQS